MVEVDPVEDMTVDHAVEWVTRLLRRLWERSWPAVSVCEYADLLPFDAGTDDSQPWPRA